VLVRKKYIHQRHFNQYRIELSNTLQLAARHHLSCRTCLHENVSLGKANVATTSFLACPIFSMTNHELQGPQTLVRSNESLPPYVDQCFCCLFVCLFVYNTCIKITSELVNDSTVHRTHNSSGTCGSPPLYIHPNTT
jgi:hypothetical protein